MNKMSPGCFWTLEAVLLALAVFLYAIKRGYGYLGCGLAFAAALLFIFRFCPMAVKIIVSVLVAIGFIWFCITEVPVIRGSRADPDPGRKYFIILGAQVRGSSPSITLMNRCEGAMKYLADCPDSIVIASGGRGEGENISEAQAMYEYLISLGLEPEKIILEDKSTNTTENLTNSFAIIRALGDDPDGNVTIVSSSYHLYRARYIAASLGVRAAAVPGTPGYPLVMLNFFIREAFGVTRLWWLGY